MSHARVLSSVKIHAFFLFAVHFRHLYRCHLGTLSSNWHTSINIFNKAVVARRQKQKSWKAYQQSPKTSNASCIKMCTLSPLLSKSSNTGLIGLHSQVQQKQNQIKQFYFYFFTRSFILVFHIYYLSLVVPLCFSTHLLATLFCFFLYYLSCSLYSCMRLVGEGKGHLRGWRTGRGRTARSVADTAKLILHRLITGRPLLACCLSPSLNCHTLAVKHACLHTYQETKCVSLSLICPLMFHYVSY